MLLRVYLFIVLTFSLAACQLAPKDDSAQTRPKNIILFIGDGMGSSYMKAYQLFRDNPKTAEVEDTLFDQMFVGVLSTDPAQPYGAIADSAAAATAMATGVKSYNGAIAVDVNGKPLLTVLEAAKHHGLSTGLVATTTVSHATPAAFASHQIDRENEKTIVDQYIDHRYKGLPYIDILLGGGRAYFERDDRNISDEFKSLGYQLINNRTELNTNNHPKLIGLFSDLTMDKMIDRDEATPSLAEMTKAAIKQLSKNDTGFFLMVEASQIDWAGHNQDIVGVISEMQDLEAAVLVAKNFVDQVNHMNDTQILITADHSTGGLSVGTEVNGENYYQWNAKVVQDIKYTPKKILKKALLSRDLVAEFRVATGLSLTEKEKQIIEVLDLDQYARNSAGISEKDYIEVEKVQQVLCQIISDRSYTGWTTHGHTGEDVFLYAYGVASDSLKGRWDNTKVGKVIFEWLDK